METQEKIKVRWTCDKSECQHSNIRLIRPYHVIFEDFCTQCGKYCHEPITIKVKEPL